jgi:pimeloyl-ACP methyl ester carboxylesterase
MDGDLLLRTHGSSGPLVIVLHGGPAAVGSAAPLAHGLADRFLVLEPWQRGSGSEPLTVARHVADLHALVQARSPGGRPGLVGESWGAMLALAYAAAHPDAAGPLALVGCGTFDQAARRRMDAILAERTSDVLRRRIDRLDEEFPDPAQRRGKRFELSRPLSIFEPIPELLAEPPEALDLRAHTETWNDMLRLQESGVYPSAFSAIRSPVLMLHGDYDPHPGPMIRASLQPHLPQLEYREWPRCGHYLWLERHARNDFFKVLRDWLARKLKETATVH